MASKDIQGLMKSYGIVGRDEKLVSAIRTALQVASTDISVLIQGESGVGKDVIPKLIHDNSSRKRKNYFPINCGGIPEGTVDSELFGHVKGAFTGAYDDHAGYFEVANGGTLFLDEVGELPLSTQVKLLRVLESGEFVRVGDNKTLKTDVRIVAATNVNLGKAIREGKFREDLFYRLSGISLRVPALRDRGRDISLLFNAFSLDAQSRYNIPAPLHLTKEAEEVMMAYKWPGNIRQLRNIVEHLTVMTESREVTPEMLAEVGVTPNSDSMDMVAPSTSSQQSNSTLEETVRMLTLAVASLKQDVEMLKERMGSSSGQSALPVVHQLEAPRHADIVTDTVTPSIVQVEPIVHSSQPIVHSTPDDDYEDVTDAVEVKDEDLNIENMERKMIIRALQKHHNRRKNAAAELGLSERTLYRKIKDYGLEE